MLLTRHRLTIPKAEGNVNLNVLITMKIFNKPTEFGNWILQNSEKKINKYCHVLLWVWKLKWLYLLLHESDRKIFFFEIFSLPSIFLEFILVTKLGTVCKPHVQSYIWKSKQQMLARKSLHNENFIPNIQILRTYSLSFALHFNSWVSFATLFTKAGKQILKIRNRKWNNNGNNNLTTLRKWTIKTLHKKYNGKTDKLDRPINFLNFQNW